MALRRRVIAITALLLAFAASSAIGAPPINVRGGASGHSGAASTQGVTINQLLDQGAVSTEADNPQAESAAVKTAREAALQARYDSETWDYHYDMSVYKYEYWSSVAILLVATSLVVVGLVLSWKQFKKGPDDNIDLKVGKDGLELSTRCIGLVVLIASLAFFYMYLKGVYPITVVR